MIMNLNLDFWLVPSALKSSCRNPGLLCSFQGTDSPSSVPHPHVQNPLVSRFPRLSLAPCFISLEVSFLTCEMGTGLLTFMAIESHEAVLTKAPF